MIHTASVAEVDNDGEACPICQEEGCVIAAQVYYRDFMDGSPIMAVAGFNCLPFVLSQAQEDGDGGNIQVEISETQLLVSGKKAA
jgi:hypothetical protein